MLNSVSGDCAWQVGLVDANDAWIRWNFAQTYCKSHRVPISKSGVWEDTRMLNSVSGDCTEQAGLEGVKLARIWWNIAWSDCQSQRALSAKSGVWEDTQMLKSVSGGLCLTGSARGCKTMPKYGGTLPKVIASTPKIGLHRASRAQGSQTCPNMVEHCLKWLPVTPGAQCKK